MRVRTAAALAGTAASLALLLSFKTPASTSPAKPRAAAGARPALGGDSPPTAPSAQTAVGSPQPGAVGAAGAAPAAGEAIKGRVVSTRYGNVQVELDTSAGRITNVVALQLPSDRQRSAEISRYAAPILHDEALQAQSAEIDVVSGATYTSDAYAQSLQAALDGHG